MKTNIRLKNYTLILICSLSSSSLFADEDCKMLGALAWDNWTKTEAGGSGSLPKGENQADYVRCKSCHGWDQLGMDGGYARRSRTATRPNAGFNDGDPTSRNIDTGSFGKHAAITAQMILHQGTGRSIAEGSASWTHFSPPPRSITNGLAYLKGYSLGNQHPDYANLLTETQVNCLIEFLNAEDTRPNKAFKSILPSASPAVYQVVDSADANAGKQFYEEECAECHAEPDNDQSKTIAGLPAGGFIAYLKEDGKFSEFFHKMRAGIPNTSMTRKRISNPSAQDAANVMKYLQTFGKITSQDQCGKSTASFDQNTKLHIPRINVSSPTGLQSYWASLSYSPELSKDGKLIFELSDVTNNTGTCK